MLCSREGTLTDYLQWGPTSHEFLGGLEEAQAELSGMIGTILDRNGLSPEDIACAVFGLAGIDSEHQKEVFRQILAETGLPRIAVMNDGYLGILAGTTAGFGAAIINGTGCSLTGLNRSMQSLQLGGQSLVMDDIAGGHVIGRNVVRLVFEDLELSERETLLSPTLLRFLTAEPDSFMEILVGRVSEGELAVKALAPAPGTPCVRGCDGGASDSKRLGSLPGGRTDFSTRLNRELDAQKMS